METLETLVAGQIEANGFEGCQTLQDVEFIVNDWDKERKSHGESLPFSQQEIVNKACELLDINFTISAQDIKFNGYKTLNGANGNLLFDVYVNNEFYYSQVVTGEFGVRKGQGEHLEFLEYLGKEYQVIVKFEV